MLDKCKTPAFLISLKPYTLTLPPHQNSSFAFCALLAETAAFTSLVAHPFNTKYLSTIL